MSPQPSDPSEPPPRHPSSGDPAAEPQSPGATGGAHPLDATPDGGGADAGQHATGPGPGQQPTPQQPYDQQAPSGYGQPGYPPPGWDVQSGAHGPSSGYPPQGYGQPGYPPGGYGQQSQPGQPYPQQSWGPSGYPQQGLAPVSASDEKLWALLSHVSIPFFGFVVPLVVYLVFKDRSAWLKDSATEALNFSILYTIAITASGILTAFLIGLVLMPLVWIVAVVFCVLAAVASNRHELYRYPVNWRLVT